MKLKLTVRPVADSLESATEVAVTVNLPSVQKCAEKRSTSIATT